MDKVYELVKVVNTISAKNDTGGSAVNGTGVDRIGFESGILVFNQGAASGTPTSYTVAIKLQDSADNSIFADVSGAALALTQANASTVSLLSFNARGLDRYVRATITVTFTGGSSPALPYSIEFVLGNADKVPVSY